MILQLLLDFVVKLINSIFGIFPLITKLPTVIGVDIDSALVTGVGQLRSFTSVFWPIGYMIDGALVIFGYYGLKMLLKLFLGHRTPGV